MSSRNRTGRFTPLFFTPMGRVRLLIAYDGTDFHGWQRQEPPGLAPLRTVQGTLQEVLTEVVAAPISLVGASRTDAGVHALGQVAAFSADHRVPLDRLPMAVNARLPADVRVRGAEAVAGDFDPISHCTSKCYRYTIEHGCDGRDGREGALLFERRTVWQTWHRLDPAPMREAAAALVGTHDFAGLANASHGRESTVRTVFGCTVMQPRAGRLVIEIAGSGFLYNMVRIIAGTLVEVGRGRIGPAQVRDILRTQERTHAGPTLPPQGLRLEWIAYGSQRGPGAAGAAPAGAGAGADAAAEDACE